MLLFSLGIVITISIYFSFTSIHDKVSNFTQKDQMEEVAKSISSSLGKIKTMSRMNDEQINISLNVTIPKKISNEHYLINATENRVMVEQDNENVTEGLSGFKESFQVKGEVHSGRKTLTIHKAGETITLNG